MLSSNVYCLTDLIKSGIKMSFRNQPYRNKGTNRRPYTDKVEEDHNFRPNNGKERQSSRGGRPPPGLVS